MNLEVKKYLHDIKRQPILNNPLYFPIPEKIFKSILLRR